MQWSWKKKCMPSFFGSKCVLGRTRFCEIHPYTLRCSAVAQKCKEMKVVYCLLLCPASIACECGWETRWMISVILLWCSAKSAANWLFPSTFFIYFFLLLKVAQVLYVLKTCPSFTSIFVRTCLLVLSKGLSCSLWMDNSQVCCQT